MGLLDRAIRNGIGKAVGGAVENAVTRVVAPKVNQTVDQAAQSFNRSADAYLQQNSARPQQDGTYPQQNGAYQPQTGAAQQQTGAETARAAATLGGIFGSYVGAAQSFANEAAKNLKICPACGEGAAADQKFCPSCGAALPAQTVAQGALCSACGTQNSIGTRFCTGCGAKLPAAVAEEQAARERDAAVMAQWDALLWPYPKWSMGGSNYCIEEGGRDDDDNPYYYFRAAHTEPRAFYAYLDLLKSSGFARPPRYSSDETLYKIVDGVSYCMNSTDAFSCGEGQMQLAFYIRAFREPEPKREDSFRDKADKLKGLFKF